MSRFVVSIGSIPGMFSPLAGVPIEDLAQLGRELVRLSRPSELATHEAAVMAREDDGLRSQSLSHGERAAVGHLARGLLAGRQHDSRGRRSQRVEIGLIA